MVEQIQYIEVNPTTSPIATVIWLHGLGADGSDFIDIVPQLQFSSDFPIRFVFPHAPMRPVTINNGYVMRAWFDVFGFEERSRQDEKGLEEAQLQIANLIQQEKSHGIASDKIILGGFSQGGALALHCGLRNPDKLAGIVALSTYLPVADKLPLEINQRNRSTQILMAHGIYDPIIPLHFGQTSCEFLKKLGYQVDWHTYPIEHTVSEQEIQDIKTWFIKLLLRETKSIS